MKRALLVVLGLGVLGCEARLSSGATCRLASECAAGLVCAAQRCRPQCVEHRDCPLGGRCVLGDRGFGSCTLEVDPACDALHPCGAGLVCVDGECFDRCIAGGCPARGACVDGRCLPAATTADGGVPVAPVEPRRPCSRAADCSGGEICVEPVEGYTCRRPCAADTDCASAVGTAACIEATDLGDAIVTICTEPCDPFTGAGCPAGETCDLYGTAGIASWVTVLDCRPVDTAGRIGAGGCGVGTGAERDETLCAASATCVGHATLGWSCFERCTLDGALGPACPAGTTCTGLGVSYLDHDLGACSPP